MIKLLTKRIFSSAMGAIAVTILLTGGASAQSLSGASKGASTVVSPRQFLPIRRADGGQKTVPLRFERKAAIPLNQGARLVSNKAIPLHGENKMTRLIDMRHQLTRPKASELPNELKLAKLDHGVTIRTTEEAEINHTPLTAVPEEKPAIPMAEEHEGIETMDQDEHAQDAKNEGITYQWPLLASDFSGISSGFGKRRHPITRKQSFHAGIDLPARKGTAVLAAADGKIAGAGDHPRLGRYVKVTHADGSYTLYGHLSKITTNYGQVVKAGDRIGKVGSTGRSTGPHLDFSIRKDGKPINPVTLLPDVATLAKKTPTRADS